MNYKFKNFPATCVLIGINVAIYLLMTFAGGSQNPGVLVRFGANFAPYVSNGEYWRLLTAMFLHIGLEHLALNMLTLYFIGASLEPILGSVRCFISRKRNLRGCGKLFFDEWLVCRSQHCVVRIIRCIFDAWRIVQKQCLH